MVSPALWLHAISAVRAHEAMIPPTPPIPIVIALATARFECERMLLFW